MVRCNFDYLTPLAQLPMAPWPLVLCRASSYTKAFPYAERNIPDASHTESGHMQAYG
jgi:hypothetical protein